MTETKAVLVMDGNNGELYGIPNAEEVVATPAKSEVTEASTHLTRPSFVPVSPDFVGEERKERTREFLQRVETWNNKQTKLNVKIMWLERNNNEEFSVIEENVIDEALAFSDGQGGFIVKAPTVGVSKGTERSEIDYNVHGAKG